jgi:phosphatidylserine/phosphatidylglycerophosphate/cardiolipin synthase-like enzyme
MLDMCLSKQRVRIVLFCSVKPYSLVKFHRRLVRFICHRFLTSIIKLRREPARTRRNNRQSEHGGSTWTSANCQTTWRHILEEVTLNCPSNISWIRIIQDFIWDIKWKYRNRRCCIWRRRRCIIWRQQYCWFIDKWNYRGHKILRDKITQGKQNFRACFQSQVKF